jgi:predicted flap endonuclease-1-like 5' DNA nuclease
MLPKEEDPPQVRQLKALLGQAKQALATKDVQLRSLSAQRDLFKTQLAERESRVRELESPRDAEVRAKVPELEQRVTEYRRQLEQRAERIVELETQLTLRSRRITELERSLAQRDQRIVALENDLAEGLAWGAQDREDDLKAIKGIGPKFERLLKALGVKTVAQIAEWSEEDVGRFASALKVPKDRIVRGGWVDKARSLVKR